MLSLGVIPCQYPPAESIRVSSTTFMQSAQKATEFSEIMQPLGLLHHSRSFKVTNFGTNRKLICDSLLVINSNLPPILHRFRDIVLQRSKFATEVFPWEDLRKILPWSQWMSNVPNGVKALLKILIPWVGRTNITDNRQTVLGSNELHVTKLQ